MAGATIMINFCVSNQITFKSDIFHVIPINNRRYLIEEPYPVLSTVLNL